MTMLQLRAALADPTGWTWQRDAEAPRAADGAIAWWLGTLDRATGGCWQRAGGAAAPTSSTVATLALRREGRLLHRFRLDGSEVRWERFGEDGRPAAALACRLAPNAAQALADGLAEVTR